MTKHWAWFAALFLVIVTNIVLNVHKALNSVGSEQQIAIALAVLMSAALVLFTIGWLIGRRNDRAS